ncbi:MAG: DUF523 and DUF1722 domain-containing protein [Calditrichaeota bacterium]|nr:DUF523 and DUF1722 domain-containing protein [Calditrichota bacterium]
MSIDVKPVVVVSKCLGFEACRYNGVTIPSEVVAKLAAFVRFVPVCPEVEIGLGVPREPIRVVQSRDGPRLLQPATGADVTDKMVAFASTFLAGQRNTHGFILKSRSPSCGIKDVKIFAGAGDPIPVAKGSGFFGAAVLEQFGHLSVEDEGRLSNFRLREHFLTHLFVTARFDQVKGIGTMGALVEFHSRHKLLLMSYSQKHLKEMGRIVANPEGKPVAQLLEQYEHHLHAALARPARSSAVINVLMHALGYFSPQLGAKEKAFFLDTLLKFREERVPLSVPVAVVKSWIARFGQPYLEAQVFFDPYPEALVEISDSGKGRDL